MSLISKNPDVDLRLKYKKTLELSSIIGLMVLAVLFYSFQRYEGRIEAPEEKKMVIESVEIPPTQQLQKPPPPSRPSIPVESEDEDLLDDVTIEETEIDLEMVIDAPPPPPEEDEIFEFFAVSEKPSIIHKEVPKFPDFAKRAGIEGTVIVMCTISKTGKVIDAKIYKSIPMLDEAALEAAKKCTFKPAKQRDKFVKVKMTLPFQFKLR